MLLKVNAHTIRSYYQRKTVCVSEYLSLLVGYQLVWLNAVFCPFRVFALSIRCPASAISHFSTNKVLCTFFSGDRHHIICMVYVLCIVWSPMTRTMWVRASILLNIKFNLLQGWKCLPKVTQTKWNAEGFCTLYILLGCFFSSKVFSSTFAHTFLLDDRMLYSNIVRIAIAIWFACVTYVCVLGIFVFGSTVAANGNV